MAANSSRIQLPPSIFKPCFPVFRCYLRRIHQQASARNVPSPTPFVPDTKTFLTLIGRNLSQHAAKIPSWESLFSLTSTQLRELGIEPARTRRYLLWWRDRFRKGIYGVGGDLQNVVDATAELRVVEVPSQKPFQHHKIARTMLGSKRKLVVNVLPGVSANEPVSEKVASVKGMKVMGAHTIVGPYIQPVKESNGSVARIKVQESMWEQRRGQKVDGGERRKAQVRHKRRIEENRKKS